MPFSYTQLCGMASDAVDAVKLGIPWVSNSWDSKRQNTLNILLNWPFQKFETLSLGYI